MYNKKSSFPKGVISHEKDWNKKDHCCYFPGIGSDVSVIAYPGARTVLAAHCRFSSKTTFRMESGFLLGSTGSKIQTVAAVRMHGYSASDRNRTHQNSRPPPSDIPEATRSGRS